MKEDGIIDGKEAEVCVQDMESVRTMLQDHRISQDRDDKPSMKCPRIDLNENSGEQSSFLTARSLSPTVPSECPVCLAHATPSVRATPKLTAKVIAGRHKTYVDICRFPCVENSSGKDGYVFGPRPELRCRFADKISECGLTGRRNSPYPPPLLFTPPQMILKGSSEATSCLPPLSMESQSGPEQGGAKHGHSHLPPATGPPPADGDRPRCRAPPSPRSPVLVWLTAGATLRAHPGNTLAAALLAGGPAAMLLHHAEVPDDSDSPSGAQWERDGGSDSEGGGEEEPAVPADLPDGSALVLEQELVYRFGPAPPAPSLPPFRPPHPLAFPVPTRSQSRPASRTPPQPHDPCCALAPRPPAGRRPPAGPSVPVRP